MPSTKEIIHFLDLPAPPSDIFMSVLGTKSSVDESTQVATLINGMLYTFSCNITGADEEPDVTWTLTLASTPETPSVETNVAATSGVDCTLEQDSETFTFTADVTEHQGQTLNCAASNSAGSVEYTVTLDVIGKLHQVVPLPVMYSFRSYIHATQMTMTIS